MDLQAKIDGVHAAMADLRARHLAAERQKLALAQQQEAIRADLLRYEGQEMLLAALMIEEHKGVAVEPDGGAGSQGEGAPDGEHSKPSGEGDVEGGQSSSATTPLQE